MRLIYGTSELRSHPFLPPTSPPASGLAAAVYLNCEAMTTYILYGGYLAA